MSVATYFPGPAEQPENSLLGPPDVVDHVGTACRFGHVSGKHIVLTTKTQQKEQKTVNCSGPCDLRTTLCDDLTSDLRTTIASDKCADSGGFEGQRNVTWAYSLPTLKRAC